MKEDFEITLKNDYAFKRLLGAEENKAILQNFLEVVLDIPHEEIEDIELLDKELKKDQLDDKTGILDVKVRFKSKTIINIEVQNLWDNAFTARTLFYWAKMYISEFKAGEPYSSLNKCITINIVGKGFDLNDLVHSKYLLIEEKTNEKLTDIMEIHFLNLEKARKLKNIDDPLVRWLLFIDTSSKEERNMLATTSPVLTMLNEKVNVLTLNPTEKILYESRMKLKSDIATISETQFNKGLEQGREQGREEGREEGEEKGRKEGIYQAKIEMAKKLNLMNLSLKDISITTGLTIQEIKQL